MPARTYGLLIEWPNNYTAVREHNYCTSTGKPRHLVRDLSKQADSFRQNRWWGYSWWDSGLYKSFICTNRELEALLRGHISQYICRSLEIHNIRTSLGMKKQAFIQSVSHACLWENLFSWKLRLLCFVQRFPVSAVYLLFFCSVWLRGRVNEHTRLQQGLN